MATFQELVKSLLASDTLNALAMVEASVTYSKSMHKNWHLPTEMSDPLYELLSQDLVQPLLDEMDNLKDENITQYLNRLRVKSAENKDKDLAEMSSLLDSGYSPAKDKLLALIVRTTLTIHIQLSELNLAINAMKAKPLEPFLISFYPTLSEDERIESQYECSVNTNVISTLAKNTLAELQYPIAFRKIAQIIKAHQDSIIPGDLPRDSLVSYMDKASQRLEVGSDQLKTDTLNKLQLTTLLSNTLYAHRSFLPCVAKNLDALSTVLNQSSLNEFLEDASEPELKRYPKVCVNRFIRDALNQLSNQPAPTSGLRR